MTPEHRTATILFSDVCGSTRIYEALGDAAAQALLSSTLSMLSAVTREHGGTIIKTIGDELMCSFTTAAEAVEAAIAMNRAVDEMPRPQVSMPVPLNIHTGFHLGPVVDEDGDIYGDAVNVAARLVSLAKQRQILTSEETTAELPPERKDALRVVDKTTLRGKTGEMSIYEVQWEMKDATVVADPDMIMGLLESLGVETKLEIKVGELSVVVGPSHPVAALGRHEHNDLPLDGTLVSRYHAKIEHRRGKFMLIDQSSNGTFLQREGHEPVLLRRDEAMILGTGLLGLGQRVSHDSPHAILYSIKNP